MLRPLIRPANSHEGPQIEALLIDNGLCPTGWDWSEIQGWMVAEHEGAVVGAIQVLYGKPMGHIGFLVVDQKRHNAGIGYFLWKEAERWYGLQGVDGYTGMTSTPVVKKAIVKSGGIVWDQPVEILMKRVWQRNK